MHQRPRWMKITRAAAATFNAGWGVAMISYPAVVLAWVGLASFPDSDLWRYAGLISLVFALGYGIAAGNPFRYWPLVLLGLAEKTAATGSLLAATASGVIPWNRSWLIAAGLVWILLFVLMLKETSRRFILEMDEPATRPRDRLLLKYASQQGFSLYELSALRPTLTVFLRHAGCPLCREALEDLSKLRPAIQRRGVGLAFVHTSSEPEAEKFFTEYGLADVPRFSDPNGGLYRAFALRRAEWREILGPRVWKRGFRAAVLKGHGLGVPESDALRMPGVFLLSEGAVVAQYRHASPAERPDYLSLLPDHPGLAWLQFDVEPSQHGSVIRQSAIFEPRGLSGIVYWYVLYPVHKLMFAGMLRRIGGIVETAAAGPVPVSRAA